MYPADHSFFSNFSGFRKHFLKIFIRTIKNPNIQFVRLKDNWMLAQHWATSWCRRPCFEQTIGAVGNPPPIIAFPEQLRAAAIDVTMWLLWSCRLRFWVFVVVLKIKTSLVVFSALKKILCFCILFKISRLYRFIWIIFAKLTKLTNSQHKESL